MRNYADALRYAAEKEKTRPRQWKDLSEAQRQQLETAVWSSTWPSGKPLDSTHQADAIHPTTIGYLSDHLDAFYERLGQWQEEANERVWDERSPQYRRGLAAEEILNGNDENSPAHDFWLTRNGHGAGFWDGDYENGDVLTALAKEFPEVHLYPGVDGLIHHEGSPDGVEEAEEPDDDDDDDDDGDDDDDPDPDYEPSGPPSLKRSPEREPSLAFARSYAHALAA